MPASRLPRPLAILTNEKLCPAIILTPSSPLDVPDYYQVLLLPPPPRKSRLGWLMPWRTRPAAIQLPISAESPSFPVTVIHPAADKRRRNRLALVIAIPLVLLLIHILLAMMQLGAYHESQVGAPAESLLDQFATLLGFGPPEHHLQGVADEPAFILAPTAAPEASPPPLF